MVFFIEEIVQLILSTILLIWYPFSQAIYTFLYIANMFYRIAVLVPNFLIVTADSQLRLISILVANILPAGVSYVLLLVISLTLLVRVVALVSRIQILGFSFGGK
jgi:hypothetical protein